MRNLGYLKDTSFLRELDNESNKFYWVKITVLDQNEGPVQSIEGQVLPGSVISIDGSSSIRRTCNITFLAEEANNDLTNINNLLSVNKKIEVLIGIENHINSQYEDVIWFPQGIYVIVQPTITNNLSSCTIQLTCKDKMCLLNGECAGNLPASVTFHEYDQIYGYEKCPSGWLPEDYFKNPNDYTVYGYYSQDIFDCGSQVPETYFEEHPTQDHPNENTTYEYQCPENKDTGEVDPEVYFKNPPEGEEEPNDYTNYTYWTEEEIIDIDDEGQEEIIVIMVQKFKWWYQDKTWSAAFDADKLNIKKRNKIWGETLGWRDVKDTRGERFKIWNKGIGWEETTKNLIGTIKSYPNRIYDIIQTLVCNYGGESLSKIFISDVPMEIKQIMRWEGDDTLYYYEYYSEPSPLAPVPKLCPKYTLEPPPGGDVPKSFRKIKKGNDCGYVYTDFTYPGKLISNLGDNVCSVLDRIKETLGNFEYFYDINGNFIFQEVKNYFNNSYNPVDIFRIDNANNPDGSAQGRKVEIAPNSLALINGTNYEVDFNGSSKSVYTFEESTGLVSAYTNTPSYTNLKNDFHIWGRKDDKIAVHYHLVLKHKPQLYGAAHPYAVVFLKDTEGNYTQKIRLATDDDRDNPELEIVENYYPADWRAQMFLDGLEKRMKQMRPDIYEQELLDMFEDIYDFTSTDDGIYYGKFKVDLVTDPNELNYFFDFLEPYGNMGSCCQNAIGTRVYSYQQDKIKRLFNTYIPNAIIINPRYDIKTKQEIIKKCNDNGGQPYTDLISENGTEIAKKIYNDMAIGAKSYTAQETARELLYQYTNYSETITIQSVPIYYLEPNTRITVYNQKAGISGDYIIKSISLPIDVGGTMTINAIRALERI